MDEPLNGGFICKEHGIGYVTKCPTCASLEKPIKPNKKQQKMMRQLIRKKNRS